MIKIKQIKKFLVVSVLVLTLAPSPAQATPAEPPILVVDKCPEFCPPGWQPLDEPIVDRCPEFCPGWEPPVEMCAQVLIPVPGRPGYWYTDSCRKTVISDPKTESDKELNNDPVVIPTPIEDPLEAENVTAPAAVVSCRGVIS